jgi:hypothetical protein
MLFITGHETPASWLRVSTKSMSSTSPAPDRLPSANASNVPFDVADYFIPLPITRLGTTLVTPSMQWMQRSVAFDRQTDPIVNGTRERLPPSTRTHGIEIGLVLRHWSPPCGSSRTSS